MGQPFLHTSEDLAFLYHWMGELVETRIHPVTLQRLQEIMRDAHRVRRWPQFRFCKKGENLWSFCNTNDNATHLYKMNFDGFVLREL